LSSPRRLVTVCLTVVLVAGAALWAIGASGSDPIDVLRVSKPEPAGRHSFDAGASRPAVSARHVPPTPAQVGQPGPLQVDSERPRMLVLPSGTRMRVRQSATSASGALRIPADINQAGWWDGSSKLGDPFGAIVVVAHVDSFTQGLGRFAELLKMKPGDVVRVSSSGLRETFSVASAGLVPKSSISATSGVFSARGPSRLVLITCGGVYDPAHGGYQSNVVVVAFPTSRVSRRN
jgi:Sortase domain